MWSKREAIQNRAAVPIVILAAIIGVSCSSVPAVAPKLAQVRSPNGVEVVDGEQFFWLGNQPATLVISAERAGPALLRAKEFWLGPSAPSLIFRTLVTECGPHRTEFTFTAGAKGIPIQLDSGTQECRIWCTDTPSVLKQANGDTRPLLLGIKGYYVADVLEHGH